nr:immunoglobulin light chain junction region [Macaca mulatta]MOW31334.1 immunoglobulin light chain junction region [Macaca mulatta]
DYYCQVWDRTRDLRVF